MDEEIFEVHAESEEIEMLVQKTLDQIELTEKALWQVRRNLQKAEYGLEVNSAESALATKQLKTALAHTHELTKQLGLSTLANPLRVSANYRSEPQLKGINEQLFKLAKVVQNYKKQRFGSLDHRLERELRDNRLTRIAYFHTLRSRQQFTIIYFLTKLKVLRPTASKFYVKSLDNKLQLVNHWVQLIDYDFESLELNEKVFVAENMSNEIKRIRNELIQLSKKLHDTFYDYKKKERFDAAVKASRGRFHIFHCYRPSIGWRHIVLLTTIFNFFVFPFDLRLYRGLRLVFSCKIFGQSIFL